MFSSEIDSNNNAYESTPLHDFVLVAPDIVEEAFMNSMQDPSTPFDHEFQLCLAKLDNEGNTPLHLLALHAPNIFQRIFVTTQHI